MFIIGVGLKSWLPPGSVEAGGFDIFYGFVFCLLGIILSIFFWNNKKYRVIFLGLIFLFLGVLRFNVTEVRVSDKHVSFYNNRNVEFVGKILEEPDVREFNQKIEVGEIEIKHVKIAGKVLISVGKYEKYSYGDIVKIKCKLEKPGVINAEDEWGRDFDYGKYLSVNSIYSVCYKPLQLSIINYQLSRFEKIKNELINARQKFKIQIDKSLPLPYSGILNAMLLGYKREMISETRNQFSQTGLSHIIAISGLHITILAGIIFYLFIVLGLSRSKAFWPAIFVLFLYVMMIGFRASAIRAFIMGVIVMYGLKIGRLSKSLNALIFSAVILLIINPKLLLFDIGFQLSFLAVLGIMIFYKKFEKWLKFISDKFKIRSIVCMTFSAQILTLPLVIYYFGVVSVISPISNLLILPVLPLIMILGICMIFLAFIWSKIGVVLGIMVWIILKYVLWSVKVLSELPGAFFKIKSFSFLWIAGFYFLIILLMNGARISRTKRIKFKISTRL